MMAVDDIKAALGKEDFGRARRLLKAFLGPIGLEPEQLKWARQKLALSTYKDKEIQSEAALEEALKDRPQVAQVHYLLATAYLAQQKRDQVLAAYRTMTDLFPQDPQPQFLIGNILLAQGQQQEARHTECKERHIRQGRGSRPDDDPGKQEENTRRRRVDRPRQSACGPARGSPAPAARSRGPRRRFSRTDRGKSIDRQLS
jgi:tetratricopeptide (TPR) repeat protein